MASTTVPHARTPYFLRAQATAVAAAAGPVAVVDNARGIGPAPDLEMDPDTDPGIDTAAVDDVGDVVLDAGSSQEADPIAFLLLRRHP